MHIISLLQPSIYNYAFCECTSANRYHPSRFGPFLRRLSRFLLPSFAFWAIFVKVDLSPLFVPRSQTILAMVPLLSAFQHSHFGPVLRRLKRFSLPPCANCGFFAKVYILCWEAEHYNTFCKWRHHQYRLRTSFVCKYHCQPILQPKHLVARIPCNIGIGGINMTIALPARVGKCHVYVFIRLIY